MATNRPIGLRPPTTRSITATINLTPWSQPEISFVAAQSGTEGKNTLCQAASSALARSCKVSGAMSAPFGQATVPASMKKRPK